MTIDPKKIFERLSKPDAERGPLSIFLDRALYKRFKAYCDAQRVSASRALEEFMRAALDESQGIKPSVEVPDDVLAALANADETDLATIRAILMNGAKTAKATEQPSAKKPKRKTG